MNHRCPAAGCTKRVRDDVLFCREHWWGLPHRMRVRLSRSRDVACSPLVTIDPRDVARAEAIAYWTRRGDAA